MKILTTKKPSDDAVPVAQLYASEVPEPEQPAQRQTVSSVPRQNMRWPRGVQITNEFALVKRFGCPTVGLRVGEIVAACVAAEPRLSWPPIFALQPDADGKAFEIEGGEFLTLVAKVNSEIGFLVRWQRAPAPDAWSDISGGEVALNDPSASFETGCHVDKPGLYRCVAWSAAGETISARVIVKLRVEPTPEGQPAGGEQEGGG